MTIDQKVKDAVKQQVLKALEQYWQEAEEHEDDSTLSDPDVDRRTADFYVWLYEGEEGPTRSHSEIPVV